MSQQNYDTKSFQFKEQENLYTENNDENYENNNVNLIKNTNNEFESKESIESLNNYDQETVNYNDEENIDKQSNLENVINDNINYESNFNNLEINNLNEFNDNINNNDNNLIPNDLKNFNDEEFENQIHLDENIQSKFSIENEDVNINEIENPSSNIVSNTEIENKLNQSDYELNSNDSYPPPEESPSSSNSNSDEDIEYDIKIDIFNNVDQKIKKQDFQIVDTNEVINSKSDNEEIDIEINMKSKELIPIKNNESPTFEEERQRIPQPIEEPIIPTPLKKKKKRDTSIEKSIDEINSNHNSLNLNIQESLLLNDSNIKNHQKYFESSDKSEDELNLKKNFISSQKINSKDSNINPFFDKKFRNSPKSLDSPSFIQYHSPISPKDHSRIHSKYNIATSSPISNKIFFDSEDSEDSEDEFIYNTSLSNDELRDRNEIIHAGEVYLLKSENQVKDYQINALKEKLHLLKKQIKKLNYEGKSREKKNSKISSYILESQSKISDLERNLRNAESRVASLQEQLMNRDKEIYRISESNQILERSLTRQTFEHKAMKEFFQEKIEVQEKQLAELRFFLDNRKQKEDKFNGDISRLSSQLENKDMQIKILQERIKSQNLQIESLNQRSQSIIKEKLYSIGDEKQLLQKEISQLSLYLEKQQSELERKDQKIRELENLRFQGIL